MVENGRGINPQGNPQDMNNEAVTLGNVIIIGSPPDRAKLAAKLSKIQGAMTRVEKKGHNSLMNYDFVREADVIDHVRPMLEAANLAIVFSDEPLATTFEHRVSKDGKDKIWAALDLRASIIDGDTGALFSYTMPGQAVDTNGDKAIYKAITGAKKYATMLGFNVATGDDPENDERRKGGGGTRRGKGADEPADTDAAAREASKARQQLCAHFPVMRDEARRDEICHGYYGKDMHEMDLKELRDLYGKLNKGVIK